VADQERCQDDVGIWAVAGGCFEIVAAFGSGESAGTRTPFILSGLVWIVFGAVLFGRLDIGAVSLALVFGFFSLFSGAMLITWGIEARRTGKTLHDTILPEAA